MMLSAAARRCGGFCHRGPGITAARHASFVDKMLAPKKKVYVSDSLGCIDHLRQTLSFRLAVVEAHHRLDPTSEERLKSQWRASHDDIRPPS